MYFAAVILFTCRQSKLDRGNAYICICTHKVTDAWEKKVSSERRCEAKEEAVSNTLSVLVKVGFLQRIPTVVRLFKGTEFLVLTIFK